MSNIPSPGATPGRVATAATQEKAADLSKPVLIGLSGAEGAFQALIRLPGGRIKQVTKGNRLSAGRVVAIDETGVVLEKNGKTRHLKLPGT